MVIYYFNPHCASNPQSVTSLAEYFGIPEKDLRMIEPPRFSRNPYSRVWWTVPLHRVMREQAEKQGICAENLLMGIVDEDIYVAGLEPIFGEYDPATRSILISLSRLSVATTCEILKDRFFKTFFHELGHALGMHHCNAARCILTPSGSLRDLDNKELLPCATCFEEMKARGGESIARLLEGNPAYDVSFQPGSDVLSRFSQNLSFVYSPGYFLDIGKHVFDMQVYQDLAQSMVTDKVIDASGFVTPEPVTWEDLALFLAPDYLDDLKHHRLSKRTYPSELPVKEEIIDGFRLAAGGTFLAARKALQDGCSCNLSGGFHHAFRDKAEGFCFINDVALAISSLLRTGEITKAAVIDLDVHQGNGTARIFQDDPRVFTMSIHQEHNYPEKETSDLDIGLEDDTGDEEYLARMRRTIPSILEFHRPDLVLYLAGADPYEFDQLGGLALSKNGLLQRDQMVIAECRKRGIPLAVVMAGGYAEEPGDTVEIHCNTTKAARGAWG